MYAPLSLSLPALSLTALLTGCQTPGGTAEKAGDTGTPAPCTPVLAVLFDLGETLVTEQEDGLFSTIPAAAEALDALEARAVPKGVVTTVPRGWGIEDLRALLVDPTLLDRFEVVLMSSEAEADPKPDPAIYTEALGLFAAPPPPGQTLFITEELADIADADPPTEGAQAAGLVGVHVHDAGAGDTGDTGDTGGTTGAVAARTISPAGLADLTGEPWFACLEAE